MNQKDPETIEDIPIESETVAQELLSALKDAGVQSLYSDKQLIAAFETSAELASEVFDAIEEGWLEPVALMKEFANVLLQKEEPENKPKGAE